jgi:2'-5' RNA ligase
MRLFVAYDLPDNVRKKLVEFQKQIGESEARIKWVEEKNIHLTLKFLGEVEEGKTKEIIKALESVKFKPFLTSISELGVFPSEKFIRVIWVGLKPFEPIEDLHERIENSLVTLGFLRDKRFQAHVTLGRVKFIRDKVSFLSKIKILKVSDISEHFALDNFKLKKSVLTPKGPIYEDLRVFEGNEN